LLIRKINDFQKLVDENPWLSHIELSNWGEIFLNPDLLKIIRYAHSKNLALTASNGVNLNTVKKELLEALVKYKFRHITCSIDGARSLSDNKNWRPNF
jgi:MoaA/NifB/PqqE/SkfB family radical SAM enzyme